MQLSKKEKYICRKKDKKEERKKERKTTLGWNRID
jgi:hypothetical protein